MAEAGVDTGAATPPRKPSRGRRWGKRTGWAALKSVVSWWDCLFEIQIQTLGSYHRERERLTRESHTSFKANREGLRNQIAQEIPLFGFYRDLLRWLFRRPDEPAPSFPGVEIVVEA